jgi:hypothetical protein
MAIQLDPVTKLPIWPNGVVPAHPVNKHGELIVAPPVYVPPPPEPPPSFDAVDPRDPFKDFSERLDGIDGSIRDAVLEVSNLALGVEAMTRRLAALNSELAEINSRIAALEARRVD